MEQRGEGRWKSLTYLRPEVPIDGGYNIPDCWIATYKKLRGGAHTGHIHPTTSKAKQPIHMPNVGN